MGSPRGQSMPPFVAASLYSGIAYAVTWLAVSPLVAQSLGLSGGALPDWWHAVGAAGPVGAAWVAARVSGGREGLRSWGASLVRFRIGGRWWAVVLGSPVLLAVVALVVAWLMSGAWGDPSVARPTGAWWLGTLAVSVAYGVGEEPGWRGFLLPQLMRRYTPLKATLLVAVVWAAWHIPFFTYRYDFAGPATVFGFLVAMLAGAFWLTFVYLGTGGSVLAVAAWHVLWNVVNLGAAQVSDLVVGVLNTAMIVLGFGVLLATKGRLGFAEQGGP